MNREELPDRFYIQKDQVCRLSDALKDLAREAHLVRAFKQREVLSHWQDIIGEEDYKHTRVTELKKGCLSIEVDSAALLHHLMNFCKENILKELQTRCKSTFISNVKFKLSTSIEG